MNILSLFDGISGARVALDRAGIKVNKYYASEIDKHAIKISKKNYPEIIQVGDITKLKGGDFKNIELLVGGSPCQGFSFAGKHLNFEDPQSKLFFEFIRLLKEIRPKYFLFENVMMKRIHQNYITKILNTGPVRINSSLVSAQIRNRLYWTNIRSKINTSKQPYFSFDGLYPLTNLKDKGLILKDIIIKNVIVNKDKFYYIPLSTFKNENLKRDLKKNQNKLIFSSTVTAIKQINKYLPIKQTNSILIGIIPHVKYRTDHSIYSINGKSPTVTATNRCQYHGIKIALDNSTWRKLTPVEYERLQTYPDNFTKGISKNQRYKALGNSFTIDVIAHILKHIKKK